MGKRNKATTDGTMSGAQVIWFEGAEWPALLVEPAGDDAVRVQCEGEMIEIPCNAWSVVKKVIEEVVVQVEEESS